MSADAISTKSSREHIWLRASVVGGLWASIEIIIGSFLHNLKVPLAGSIMTMIGIIFLVSFFQLWPYRGLLWRAGLICALMKSISPSAVILGPMTGILMEAFIMEGMILLLGRNLVACLAGGATAMLGTLIHKLVNLLIYYGLNLVVIFENLYQYAVKQLNITTTNPWWLILLLALIYLSLGLVAAWVGYLTGKNASLLEPQSPSGNQDVRGEIFRLGEEKRYSKARLVLLVVFIPGILYLLNALPLAWGMSLTALLTLLILVYYPSVRKRFRRMGLWIQLLLIILLASFFIGNLGNHPRGINLSGLLEGCRMALRAVMLFTGFSALSVELRNPVVKTFLVNQGLSNLYTALSLAFAILPQMTETISRPSDFLKNPLKSIPLMLRQAEHWLATVQKEKESRQNV